ncbi:unnamed protein product [Kuraishia capsulata CBS 1993]|uniref:Fe2OG dioxygenase domain-containing protein n=1 Tax=Kuraishia capsulata CBS 1993 TaxID=1382522 RepID=W6MIT1_9ASCO|nr:uncharacterized protein KUCA_T00002376001 [Kuraishia capsulata CBS 1993]CDK26404.1 unnamed protein product [Kuraishia capsulata CBS 1993]
MSTLEIDQKYNVRPFVDVHETKLKNEIPIVRLDAVDLSQYVSGPEGYASRVELAKVLEASITTYGFFNLVNFGYDLEKIEHLRAVAQSLLQLPSEEKGKYLASTWRKEDEPPIDENFLGGERGQGFKPKGYWPISEGVRDSITHYNFKHLLQEDYFLSHLDQHPELVRAHAHEILAWYQFIHNDILLKISNLCDIILGLQEGTIWERVFKSDSQDEKKSAGGHARFMLYEPYDDENSLKSNQTWLRGHSDISGFSFITSQPMLTLQIKDYFDGEWKYVDHRPGSLIVNIGDAMEFISGGYFKACLHRVVEPPQDQKRHDRIVLIYFCNPKDGTPLNPDFYESSKLKSLGYSKADKLKNWEDITFADWNTAKGQTLGRKNVGERNQIIVYGRNLERWHHFEAAAVN